MEEYVSFYCTFGTHTVIHSFPADNERVNVANMANFVKYILFSCLFVITLAIDDSELKLSDTKECSNFCQLKFPKVIIHL